MATVTANSDADMQPQDNQPRKVPLIRREDVQRNIQGAFCYSSWFIRLPAGLVFQDLNDAQNTIWKNVQSYRGTALNRFDNVRLVAYDEDWFADGTVIDASLDKVVLGGLKRVQMSARMESFVTNDGLYKAEWSQAGYGIFSRSNEQWVPMTGLGYHPTLERAKYELMQRCYPKNMR